MRAFLVLGLLGLATPVRAAIPGVIAGIDAATQKPVSVAIRSAAKGTVVVFMSAKCPCSMSHEKKLSVLSERFKARGFAFVGVHSNADEPSAMSQSHFQTAAVSFPVVEDPSSEFAKALGALKTPHAYVLSPEGKVLFEGGVDDSHDAAASREQFLESALVAVSEGRDPPKNKARALGCVIQRP